MHSGHAHAQPHPSRLALEASWSPSLTPRAGGSLAAGDEREGAVRPLPDRDRGRDRVPRRGLGRRPHFTRLRRSGLGDAGPHPRRGESRDRQRGDALHAAQRPAGAARGNLRPPQPPALRPELLRGRDLHYQRRSGGLDGVDARAGRPGRRDPLPSPHIRKRGGSSFSALSKVSRMLPHRTCTSSRLRCWAPQSWRSPAGRRTTSS